MAQKEYSKLTDQELLAEAKKSKSNSTINALIIGFIVGVVIYGVVKNGFGFFMLIPLVLAYKFSNKPKSNVALEKELAARDLKK